MPKIMAFCECGSKYPAGRSHTHLRDRNHENDPVKPELTHRVRNKKRGDMCSCGGNQDCKYCGGKGRIQ